MGNKRNHESAARLAWAAEDMIANPPLLPKWDDDEGWKLFRAASNALREYAQYMYEKGQ
jgi:hypothetical protein